MNTQEKKLWWTVGIYLFGLIIIGIAYYYMSVNVGIPYAIIFNFVGFAIMLCSELIANKIVKEVKHENIGDNPS